MRFTRLLFVNAGIPRVFHLGGILFCLSVVAQPESGSEQVRALSDRILAPCCWREAVSVHQSPAAENIRRQIASQVAAGASDGAIMRALVREHGRRILREPEGQQQQWLYWVPVTALAGGIAFIARFLMRSKVAEGSSSGAILPEVEAFLKEEEV